MNNSIPQERGASWRQILSADAYFSTEDATLLHFGSPEQELRQAVNGSLVTPLPQFACIEAEGAEARAFLHAQFTNDVQNLPENTAQFSAWCTAKGRMLANFILHPYPAAAGEKFRLLLATELVPTILKRLRMYVLRSKVALTDHTNVLGHLGLAGTDTPAVLGALGLSVPEENMRLTLMDNNVTLLTLPDGRYILSAPWPALPELWQQLSARLPPVGVPVWQWLDVRAGLPWVGGATTEAFVPQMMDFEKMGGVSFKKGCYPGQEIIARSQYLGQIKRHLYRVESKRPLASGEDLFSPTSPGQSVGKVVTAAPTLVGACTALAVVLENAAPDLRQNDADGPKLQATAVYKADESGA
jgi:folate-binding protein YgfZ